MLLVRVDPPGAAAPLELHPRLTLVRGADPELVALLRRVVRALAGGPARGVAGVIEISGIRLAIDPTTLAELGLDDGGGEDPVVGFAAGEAHEQTATDPVDDVAVGPAPIPDDRDELRRVGRERAELAGRMDDLRDRLDASASAAVEVCRGQIDALVARRDARRRELERAAAAAESERARRDAEVRRAQEADRAEQARRIARALPDAIALLVADVDRTLVLASRREALRDRLERCRERRRTLPDAEHPDPALVERLEAVRADLVAVADGHDRDRSARELRAEEAVLLDRLGYETYSSFVMGDPSRDALAEAETRRRDLLVDIEHLEAELREVEVELEEVDPTGRRHRELVELVGRAAELLGADPERHLHAVRAVERHGGGATEVAVLRSLGDDMTALAERPAPRAPDAGAPPLREAGRPGGAPAAGAAVGADELADDPELAAIDRDLADARDRLAAARSRMAVHQDASARLADLRVRELSLRDRERTLLERIAALREQGGAPVASTQGRVIDVAVVGEGPGAPAPTGPQREPEGGGGEVGVGVGGESVGRGDAEIGVDGGADGAAEVGGTDAEWHVVERLAALRRVSFVGAVPLLVEGVPPVGDQRRRVLARLARVSDLVQVVLVSDDPDVWEHVRGLGTRAAVVERPSGWPARPQV